MPKDYTMLMELPEQRPTLIESLVARVRPELYQLYRNDGVDFYSKDFLEGLKLENKSLLN